MLSAVNPVSFQAKVNYEGVTKMVDRAGEEFSVKLKAISEARKSYKFNTCVFDKNNAKVNEYSNEVKEGVIDNMPEFAQAVYGELSKIFNMFSIYKVENSNKILRDLVNFFKKCS